MPASTADPQHEIVLFKLRLPRGMLDQVRALSRENYRTVSSEMREALREHIAAHDAERVHAA